MVLLLDHGMPATRVYMCLKRNLDLSRPNIICLDQSTPKVLLLDHGISTANILDHSIPMARTALLLRTEMSILRVDKMRPLFQEAIVTKLLVTQNTTRYQIKATDIIFPMIPHEYLWVKWFGHQLQS